MPTEWGAERGALMNCSHDALRFRRTPDATHRSGAGGRLLCDKEQVPIQLMSEEAKDKTRGATSSRRGSSVRFELFEYQRTQVILRLRTSPVTPNSVSWNSSTHSPVTGILSKFGMM